MKKLFTIAVLSLSLLSAVCQSTPQLSPCSDSAIVSQSLQLNPEALIEVAQNEIFTNSFIQRLESDRINGGTEPLGTYVIPVVLHVFHNGDDGKIDMEQALSGIDILNNDFNGLNDDWHNINPQFDSIKASLDIKFCLSSIDPDGSYTSGVVYHEDSLAMLNEKNLYDFAWDNYKYLNVYLPKYIYSSPSIFTGYSNYPSTWRSDNNTDGIVYSSIRWGYGENSELLPGQEWASVGTHEAGHWLNLRHTFENGCRLPGDYVGDTPPTLGGNIILSDCDNNDLSCGVHTNGENYMDYNHDCKKMFTKGQVDRMTAALHLPSRITLWSESNLIATGCNTPTSIIEEEKEYLCRINPNPSSGVFKVSFSEIPDVFSIYDIRGTLIYNEFPNDKELNINLHKSIPGIYFYFVVFNNIILSDKLIIK